MNQIEDDTKIEHTGCSRCTIFFEKPEVLQYNKVNKILDYLKVNVKPYKDIVYKVEHAG